MTTPTAIPATSTPELQSLWHVAHAMAASRQYRDAFTAEEAFARILAGRDVGLSPTDSMLHVTFLDGQPYYSAEIQGAMLRNFVGPDGERYDFRVDHSDEDRCVIRIRRRGPGEAKWETVGTETFTMADAEAQELTASDWYRRQPRKMCYWRCLTNAIDFFAPEVTHPRVAAAVAELADAAETPEHYALPVASSDPLADAGARVEDPRGLTKAQGQHLKRHHEALTARGQEQRFIDALNAVGAPDHEEVVQRYMSLNENQGNEVCMRLGKTPGPLRNEGDGTSGVSTEG